MKIHGITLENFMLFDKLDTTFSPNVNIICGENSTGKTALIKLLYACAKDASDWEEKNSHRIPAEYSSKSDLNRKIASVFGLDWRTDISSLIKIPSNGTSHVSIEFEGEKELKFSIDKSSSFGASRPIPISVPSSVVYIPPKEMISATENFTSLYEEYHISFDETYYDLARLLDRPRKKNLVPEIQAIVERLEYMIGGSVRQQGKAFYLVQEGVGELKMSLVSEGYRKLATLINLAFTGSLSNGAVLFWDEPETNMNPRMMEPLVKAILALASVGVQVFIITHDYFVQQYFGLAAEYGEKYLSGTGNLEYRFFSLSRTPENGNTGALETVTLESAARLSELEHNAIRDEFDAVYDREQGLIYGNDAE